MDVCNEINFDSGSREGFHLNVMRWETHAFPTASFRSQQAINEQIGDDYDLFIGLMSVGFGSHTGVYNSGTEEEFERAYARNRDTGYPEIMFYFYSGSADLTSLKSTHLAKIENFRQSLRDRGILYWNYHSAMELRVSLHRHLNKAVRSIIQKQGLTEQSSALTIDVKSAFDPLSQWNSLLASDPEVYLSELAKEFNKDIRKSTLHLKELSTHIGVVGKRMQSSASKISKALSEPNVKVSKINQVLTQTIIDIDKYEDQLKSVIPKIYTALESALSCLQRIMNLSLDSTDMAKLVSEVTKGLAATIIEPIPTVTAQVSGLRDAAEGWPDLPILKSHKRKLAALHDDLISMLQQVEKIGREIT